jgi:hypothetical protein
MAHLDLQPKHDAGGALKALLGAHRFGKFSGAEPVKVNETSGFRI